MSLAPKRVYAGRANGRIRYFHIKMPVAVEQDRAIFAYIDPGTSTRSPLHSWGQAHRQLWDKLPQASRTVEAFTVAWDRHHLDRTQRVLQAWTTRDPAAAKTEAAGLRPRPPWRSTAVPSLPLPPGGTAPQQLLFAVFEPDQTTLLPHCVQDAGDGGAFDLDVISQLPGRDFGRWIPLLDRLRGPFQCDIPVGSDLRYYTRGGEVDLQDRTVFRGWVSGMVTTLLPSQGPVPSCRAPLPASEKGRKRCFQPSDGFVSLRSPYF